MTPSFFRLSLKRFETRITDVYSDWVGRGQKCRKEIDYVMYGYPLECLFFHPQESKWAGIEYCVMLVVVGFIGAICETHTYFHLNNAGIKMKTALISAIYRKSLKMLQPNGKLLEMSSSLNFSARASPSYEGSEPSWGTSISELKPSWNFFKP